jgi:D-apionolactonase
MHNDANTSKVTAADLLRTFGTTQSVPPPTVLTAGDLSCELDGGAVRHVRWRGVEVIRGMAYLLRDTDWGTVPCHVTGQEVDRNEGRFRVRFDMHWALPEGVLSARANIEGDASCRLLFVVRAVAQSPLTTNRCGFVVLHPASAAQAPLHIEHTDGLIEETEFPRVISPGQVAFNIRRLRHVPQPGLTVDCLLQAELPHDPIGKFEMEDQRNWSDASFKTYVASLLDPWPYILPANRPMEQSVLIAVSDTGLPGQEEGEAEPGVACIAWGEPSAHRMPAIGLGVPSGLDTMTPAEFAAVVALKPAWLVAEADARDAGPLATQLQHLAHLAAACGAHVQLDVICPSQPSPDEVATAVAVACASAGLRARAIRACPAPYLKSYQPTDRWPDVPSLETYARAFAAQFPEARIGGGMLTYFTEVNRKRQTAEALDFVGHSTCPLVHAADDVSVMQTHESLAGIHASIRAEWPTLAYRLGPITLAMRRNPYGERTADNPARERIAMAEVDPRHQAAFGAAWVAAYAAAVQTFDLDLLSFNHSHGGSGPLLRDDMPGWQVGACVPAWKVQWVLGCASGCAVLPLTGLPREVAGLAWMNDSGSVRQMLLINRASQSQPMELRGAWIAADLGVPCSIESMFSAGPLPAGTQPCHSDYGADASTSLCLRGYQTLWLQQGQIPAGL